jgi:hypothetical protein
VSYDGTLLLEEFGCNYYKYKEGYQNLVTNTLSRVLTSRLVREKTKQLLIDQPEQYALVTLGETNLICYIANLQQPKIVLTDDMLPRIVRYYHLIAQHAEGMDRLEWSLKRHFYHLRLRDEVCSQVS